MPPRRVLSPSRAQPLKSSLELRPVLASASKLGIPPLRKLAPGRLLRWMRSSHQQRREGDVDHRLEFYPFEPHHQPAFSSPRLNIQRPVPVAISTLTNQTKTETRW